MTIPQQPEEHTGPGWASGPAFAGAGGPGQPAAPGLPPASAPFAPPAGPPPAAPLYAAPPPAFAVPVPPVLPELPEVPAAPRELPPASRFLRLVARTLDYLLVTALVVPLWFAAYHYLQGKAADLQNDVFRKTFFALLRGGADDAKRAPLQAVDGLWDTTKLLLLLLVLAHLLLPTLYDWLMHARYGRTLGKMAVGIKVVGPDGGSRIGLARAARRSAVAVFVPWAALMLMWYELILRNWSMAGLCGVVSLLGFVDPLLVLGPRRRSWHDRVGGTAVVNVKALVRAVELGRAGGQAARQAAQQAAQALPGQAARIGAVTAEQARGVRDRMRRPRG